MLSWLNVVVVVWCSVCLSVVGLVVVLVVSMYSMVVNDGVSMFVFLVMLLIV